MLPAVSGEFWMTGEPEWVFLIETPIGFTVRSTHSYWNTISTTKHPVMMKKLDEVKLTLSNPDEIRQSRVDSQILLFYRAFKSNRWYCAVVKRLDGMSFLVTAYPTENIKEGKRLWMK